MQAFIGSKIVLAIAMTRLAYNEYRGWQLPANENGADDGYLVEYTDGGAPNDARHEGYISWSPKAQFDGGYVEFLVTQKLPAFQLRLHGERARLQSDLAKLNAFMGNLKVFSTFDPEIREAMRIQASGMGMYLNALTSRIDLIAAKQKTL